MSELDKTVVPGSTSGPITSVGSAPARPSSHAQSTLSPPTGSASGLESLGTPSVSIVDLLNEKLLITAPRLTLRLGQIERTVPSLGGIPLLAKLGQGGMGAVYFGIHPRLRQEVAVKVLPFHLAEQQPELIQRFFREAQAAASIHSQHLVTVLDVNEEVGLFFLVMEYVSGISAGAYLKKRKQEGKEGCDEAVALDICIAATDGLAAAHAEGIIHRDIKPDNIMLPKSRTGDQLSFKRAKLADLGLARSAEHGQSLTGAQAIMGTPGYMAPEQAQDAKSAVKPADVYSMGATLYALLCGAPPFTGSTPMQQILAALQQPHIPMTQVRSDVSAATSALLERCLVKNPADRIPDADTLLELLQECRKNLGVPSQGSMPAGTSNPVLPGAAVDSARVTKDSTIPGARLAPVATAAAEKAVVPSAQSVPAPNKSYLGVAAIGLLVLLAGGGAFWFINNNKAGEARRVALETRRTEFEGLLAEGKRLMHSDPDQALNLFSKAAQLGKGSESDHLPDLTDGLPVALAALREEAQACRDEILRKAKDAKESSAKQDFVAGVEAAKYVADRGDWAAVKTSLEKALSTLGALDHPAKASAISLMQHADTELKKRADFEVRMTVADKEFAEAQFAQAKESYQAAKQLWPASPDIAKVEERILASEKGLVAQRYAAAIEAGQKNLNEKQFSEAERSFQEALSIRANDAAALKGINQAKDLARDERYGRAMRDGRGALKNEHYSDAEAAFISALNEKAKDEAAISGLAAARAGAMEGRYANTLEQGRTALATRQWAQAMAAFQEALKLRPGDSEALKGMQQARYEIAMDAGRVAMSLKSWVEAERSFQDALREKPGDAEALRLSADLKRDRAMQKARDAENDQNYSASERKHIWEAALPLTSNNSPEYKIVKERISYWNGIATRDVVEKPSHHKSSEVENAAKSAGRDVIRGLFGR